jgi:hypothetical protein
MLLRRTGVDVFYQKAKRPASVDRVARRTVFVGFIHA